MIMELPQRFRISFAEVKNGKLVIYNLMRYEDMIYELTYALKKRKCVYCGRKLERHESTLDHRYPRDTGGISITNNLFPCCPKCNSSKGNMMHQEYLKYRVLSPKEQEKYLKQLERQNNRLKREIGFKLPRKWVTFEDRDEIKYRKPEDSLRGKKYDRILGFYTKYKKLPRPAIVDMNNYLLDGFNIVLFAEDFDIREIPVIKLENVEVLNN